MSIVENGNVSGLYSMYRGGIKGVPKAVVEWCASSPQQYVLPHSFPYVFPLTYYLKMFIFVLPKAGNHWSRNQLVTFYIRISPNVFHHMITLVRAWITIIHCQRFKNQFMFVIFLFYFFFQKEESEINLFYFLYVQGVLIHDEKPDKSSPSTYPPLSTPTFPDKWDYKVPTVEEYVRLNRFFADRAMFSLPPQK